MSSPDLVCKGDADCKTGHRSPQGHCLPSEVKCSATSVIAQESICFGLSISGELSYLRTHLPELSLYPLILFQHSNAISDIRHDERKTSADALIIFQPIFDALCAGRTCRNPRSSCSVHLHRLGATRSRSSTLVLDQNLADGGVPAVYLLPSSIVSTAATADNAFSMEGETDEEI